MKAIRRSGLLFLVLVIGIFLGTLGLRSALLIVTPLFIMWLMVWDEKHFLQNQKKQHNQYYAYKK